MKEFEPALMLDKKTSLLLVIDVQEKLAPAISDIDLILKRLQVMLSGARMMNVPVMFTEHCSDRIGLSVESLRELVADAIFLPKTWFGAFRDNDFCKQLQSLGRRQIVIAGTETHVCVMQTALGLLDQEYEVFLVTDGTGSRKPEDRETAIKRLCLAGAIPVTSEMVLFEWLEHANADSFREVLKLIKSL